MKKSTDRRICPIWTAGYPPEGDPLYTGCPLTDTLLPLRSQNEWVAQLLDVPPFDPSQRALPSHVRAYQLIDLKRVFIPTPVHTNLAHQLDLIIRWGYAGRRFMSEERQDKLQKSFERCQASGKIERMVFSDNLPKATSSLIGISGMGKTTTIQRILGSIPQCIHHPQHGITQVVWIKAECPKDGSILQLALNILKAFDEVLGTNHAGAGSSRVTADQLLERVCVLAIANHLGVLVLDELQNLSAKKSGGREAMLNWVQELVNEMTVPVFLLGTFKVRTLLKPELRHARRACVLGGHTWDPLKRGKEFEYVMRKLWIYYWLRDPAELTDEMLETIYVETQGVRAFMVDMFLVAQLHALWKGVETITPKFFHAVARDAFALVQPALNALRSNQTNRLLKFEDLLKFDVDDEIERVTQLIPAESGAETSAPADPQTSMLGLACSNIVLALGLSQTEAKQLVMKAQKDHAPESAKALTTAAIAVYMKMTGAMRDKDEGNETDA